jgi:APA family basic amino acid/polyamine antiporter/amino acid efflux transporter
LTEKDQEQVLPTRNIGLLAGVLYGIGCGIGGSIFILLGTAIEEANSGVLFSLILGGILIILIALNYSELSTSLPISGGAYNFSKEALGGFLAFIIGFFLWVANIATFSFSAQAFAVVIDAFFPFSLLPPIFLTIAIISILFTAIIAFRTQRLAMRALIISTVILLVIFAIFIIAGLFIAPSINSPSYDPQFLLSETNFFSVISMFSLMFIFFTSITSNLAYLNADLKNPSKNILKVNILAIFVTLFIYLSITVIVLININNTSTGLSETPILLAVVLGDILGLPGLILMGIAAAISTLIAMNAALSSALSIMHALARDNYVSKKLLKTSKKTKVPTLILIITTSIAIIFTFLSIIFANIGFSANITTFIYFIGLAFINYAAVNLRRKRKELDRPFKAPFFPYLPIIVMSFCIILALFLEWRAIVLGVIIFSIGITYYLLTIADRHSIILTIAGLKFFAVILVGGFIWIINNLSILSSPITGFTSIFSDILLRILIFVCIFTLATIFFDIIPLKELIYFFIKKVNKKEVAIDIGIGQIIELKKSKAKIIYYANIIIGIVQIFSSLFIFTLISLFALDIISIDNITFGSTITPQVTGEYLILGFLIFLGTILLFSGPYSLYLNKETKTLGI